MNSCSLFCNTGHGGKVGGERGDVEGKGHYGRKGEGGKGTEDFYKRSMQWSGEGIRR